MKTLIKISLLTIFPVLFFAVIALAQDKPKDTFKLGVAFSNTEYYDLFSTEYNQGLIASAKFKVASYDKFALHGEFEYRSANLISGNPPTLPPIEGPVPTFAIGGNPRNDTYSFGLSFSRRFGPIEPYAHALFGFNTTYNADRKFSRIYGFGADLNLGHVYIRPIQIDWQRTEGFNSPATQSFSAGVGVRF